MTNAWTPEPENDDLQHLVDALFEAGNRMAYRMDAIVLAETFDLEPDLMEVIEHLPPVALNRLQLTDQLNATLAVRNLSHRYGIVS